MGQNKSTDNFTNDNVDKRNFILIRKCYVNESAQKYQETFMSNCLEKIKKIPDNEVTSKSSTLILSVDIPDEANETDRDILKTAVTNTSSELNKLFKGRAIFTDDCSRWRAVDSACSKRKVDMIWKLREWWV